MVIVSENLRELIEQEQMIDASAYDTFSVTLTLGDTVIRYKKKEGSYVVYGDDIKPESVEKTTIRDGLILAPGDAILACSKEEVKMPKGYMGLIQTKGSLARLFISVHCSDGQIEPGFQGHVTFEICNLGNLSVKLLPDAKVSQMYVFKVSSKKDEYKGKYRKSDKPTISKK